MFPPKFGGERRIRSRSSQRYASAEQKGIPFRKYHHYSSVGHFSRNLSPLYVKSHDFRGGVRKTAMFSKWIKKFRIFFAIRLSCNGCITLPQEVCWNRQFIAVLCRLNLDYSKNADFEL